MNHLIFWRLAWKEYRLQRAIWLAMAVLTALLLLLVFALTRNPTERLAGLFEIALALSAFYCLGCGATLFAGEHEADTYQFQRAIPVTARQVFLAKLAFALVSAAAMFAVMWLLAIALSGWTLPTPHEHVVLWGVLGLFGVEMFLWATLFSLLGKQPLLAAVLGVALASLSDYVLAASHFSTRAEITMQMYFAAVPWRVAVAAVVAAADAWLGLRWFRERVERPWRLARSTVGSETPTLATEFSQRFRAPARMAILGRLIWQHRRQSVSVMGAFTAIIILLALVPEGWLAVTPPSRMENSGSFELREKPLYWVALAGVPLLGACAFLADQRRRSFRFLADRGVPPKYIWLSRLLVASAPLALVLPVLLVFAYFLAPEEWRNYRPTHVRHPMGILTFVSAYVVVTFAAGQLCSLFLRSGVLAATFTVLAAVLLAGWCGLMWLWEINWFWSVLPIPLALLLATRLRTPCWLIERNSLWAWTAPLVVLLLPTAAVLTAVPYYRVHTVPVVDPGFSPAEYASPLTPEEQATLDLYEKACENLHLDAFQTAPVNDNQEAIALALKASRGKRFRFLLGQSELKHLRDLAKLMVFSAAKLEAEGDLDAAWEQYLAAIRICAQMRDSSTWWQIASWHERDVYARLPYWATRPNQTPERILQAVRQLEQLVASLSAGSNAIKEHYTRFKRFLSGDPTAMATYKFVPLATMLWLRLPWERTRALRMLDSLTREQLDTLSRAESEAQRGAQVTQPEQRYFYDRIWGENRELPYALRREINIPPMGYGVFWGEFSMVWDYTAAVTSRRAVLLVLALEAWKLKHGSLPKTLDELVGPCLARLPVDPYSGESFLYFPDGLKLSLPWRQRSLSDNDQEIAASTPFVWSAGGRLEVEPREKNFRARYRIIDFRYTDSPYIDSHSPESEYDVWESGWPFPIP